MEESPTRQEAKQESKWKRNTGQVERDEPEATAGDDAQDAERRSQLGGSASSRCRH